jgi:hypothetical protein
VCGVFVSGFLRRNKKQAAIVLRLHAGICVPCQSFTYVYPLMGSGDVGEFLQCVAGQISRTHSPCLLVSAWYTGALFTNLPFTVHLRFYQCITAAAKSPRMLTLCLYSGQGKPGNLVWPKVEIFPSPCTGAVQLLVLLALLISSAVSLVAVLSSILLYLFYL